MQMYPIAMHPRLHPKIEHNAASRKLSFMTTVPTVPTTIVFRAIPMLNHVRRIWKEAEALTACRSSGDTGSIPLNSSPLTFNAHR
jgi:hypothetical protein